MKTRIVSDSSCDIWNLDEVDFASVPLTISTDERTFIDDENLDVQEMVDYLAHYNSRSHTACPSIDAWLTAFGDADELYVVALTSGLSGTYNSALNAKEMYLETHPDAKVLVIDSLSTSAEQLLIIEKIEELIKLGKSFEEISVAVKDYQQKTHLFFCLKSLHNFAQNGRVPKILAQAVGVLGLNIIGKASESGTVEPIAKCRGQQSIVNTVIAEMKKLNFAGGKVNIAHSHNQKLAEALAESLGKHFPEIQTKIYPTRGLCAYYAEDGALLIGFEG